MRRATPWALIFLGVSACGGSEAGQGNVRVELTAEETIAFGLTAGTAAEDTRDYGVVYTKYLAVVGRVKAARGGQRAADPGTYLVDMKLVGDEGLELTVLPGLEAGQWPELGFETPAANDETVALPGVSEADAAEMREAGYTYWIEGSVLRPPAEGGEVRFQIKTAAPALYERCELDGQPGFAVREGGASAVTFTLHGDHLWFDGFPVGEEGKLQRRAVWLTRIVDRAGDGVIDTADLAAADATEVLAGYDLAGNPGGAAHPVLTALDWAAQQLATQGHYKGEGECAWTFDP